MNKISKLKRDRDKQKHIYNKIVPNMIKLTHVPLLVFLLDECKSQRTTYGKFYLELHLSSKIRINCPTIYFDL